MADEFTPRCYTVKEVAEILKLPLRTVYHLIATKRLRAVRVGKHIRVPHDALLELLGYQKTQSAAKM